MIDVVRNDYKEKIGMNGKLIRPKFYECEYFWEGKKIAWYNSQDDVLYLKSTLLGGNYRDSYIERMNSSPYKEEFGELINLLSINEKTLMSEFF